MPAQFGKAVFVVPDPRLGMAQAVGPSTGRFYVVHGPGDWVHIDDVIGGLMELTTFCPIVGAVVKKFEYGNPSSADVQRVPSWAYEPAIPAASSPEPEIEEVPFPWSVPEVEEPDQPEPPSRPRRRGKRRKE